jgi:hypothetical protein
MDMECVVESDLWYQSDELKKIKRQAIVLSRDECANYLGPLLSNTYGKTSLRAENAIHSWVMSCVSRRGLERFVSKDYSMKRSDSRMRNMQVVLTAQHKMKTEGLKNAEYMSIVGTKL